MEAETNVSPRRLSQLKAEATHARERYTLYRAKSYGPKMTSPSKLQLLKRESILTKRRYDHARADAE
jgi:hypothetical protein